MKKRPLALLCICVLGYVLLILLLLLAERDAGSGIRTLWDAVWFSAVTVTSVGYGDLVPVTAAGKVIGYAFIVLSVGVLAAAVSALIGIWQGRLLPGLRLWRIRRKPWYVFTEDSVPSRALAEDLRRGEPDACVVFCASPAPVGEDFAYTPQDAASLLRSRIGRAGRRTVFITGPDEWRSAALAQELRELGAACHCLGRDKPQLTGVSFFDPARLCAVRYWQEQPLSADEHRVLLIGDGTLARAMLEQALLVCCRQPFFRTDLQAVGDWADYLRLHPDLLATLGTMSGDSLTFTDGPWNRDPALFAWADRLILCADDPLENARIAADLRDAFPVSGALHAYTAVPSPCEVRFGGPQTLFTVDLVMRRTQDRLARALHADYCTRTGQKAAAWDALDPFAQASNRAAADHLITKLRLLLPEEDVRSANREVCRRAWARYQALTAPQREQCLRNEHERWCRFHALHNWHAGPERDSRRRTHPCMVPFDALSAADQEKDAGAWEQIGHLAQEE